MEPSEIITTIAEIAIALIGFSAIVVVLNPKPIRDWAASDRFNFRILVQVAAVVVFFSILPFGTRLLFNEYEAWKYALLGYGAFHLLDITSFVLKFPPGVLRINRTLPRFGFVVIVFQVVVPFVGSSSAIQATYLASLVWHLIVSFVSFIILVYGVRGQSDA